MEAAVRARRHSDPPWGEWRETSVRSYLVPGEVRLSRGSMPRRRRSTAASRALLDISESETLCEMGVGASITQGACAGDVRASCRAATTRWPRRSASSRIRAGGGRRSRRSGRGPRTACSTSPAAPAWSAPRWSKRWGCRVVGLDQSAAMLGRRAGEVGRRPGVWRARADLRRGRSREPALRRRASSTTSPSPTCCATSTIRRRRCASWRGS